ncbi:MAG: S1 RNA-binding domain-containing protein [Ferruginibacter sp.]
MSDKYIPGKITFIHHEKNRAVIEYEENGKKKTIQADIDDRAQAKLIAQKIIKKPHRFLVGDNVKFQIKKTGGNGRILYADNIQYQYNTALEILINKAEVENKFLGYIKITDHEYFIKEIDSYLFFPLKVSAYEIAPTEKEIEKPVSFKLENIVNPEKIAASLYNHNYIPEFQQAVQHFKKQTVIESVVTKITPYGIYLNLINGKIEAKLGVDELISKQIEDKTLQVGTVIPVLIKHLTAERIVVERDSVG